MKKVQKRLIPTVLLGLTMIVSPFYGNSTFATVTNEVEPNGSTLEYQRIERNNHEPAQMINGNNESQKVLSGKLESSTDEDWYLVRLESGRNILSINGSTSSAMSFLVLDSSLERINEVNFQKDLTFKWGAFPHYVDIPTEGDYYVVVLNNRIGSSGEYLFTIGSPNYTVSSYEYTSPRTLTLTPTIKTIQDQYDLTNVTSVPKDAIVYQLDINGTKVNSAISESRSIKLKGSPIWTSTSTYTWMTNFSVSSPPSTINKLLRSSWEVKIDGTVTNVSKPYSLTPKIRFSYVFPILPDQY